MSLGIKRKKTAVAEPKIHFSWKEAKRQKSLLIWSGIIVIYGIIFYYLPLGGWLMAFQNYRPIDGLFHSEFVGLQKFQQLFSDATFLRVIRNTLAMGVINLVVTFVTAIAFAILLNEVRNTIGKKTVQTISYLPHFLSWIILSGVLIDILSPSTGIVNKLIMAFGGQPAFFLGDNRFFQGTMIVTDIWKEFGFNTIVYLAAITSIDPSLYESAVMDGANRLQQIIHITLPGMLPIIMLMLLLNIGSVMNANFDQIFNLYSPTVYKTGDVLDTLVYRIGLVNANYSLSTAIGIFKSMVSMLLVGTSYYSAYKFAGYRIF